MPAQFLWYPISQHDVSSLSVKNPANFIKIPYFFLNLEKRSEASQGKDAQTATKKKINRNENEKISSLPPASAKAKRRSPVPFKSQQNCSPQNTDESEAKKYTDLPGKQIAIKKQPCLSRDKIARVWPKMKGIAEIFSALSDNTIWNHDG